MNSITRTLLFCSSLLLPLPLMGQLDYTNTTTTGTQDWDNSANWKDQNEDPGIPNGATDTAYITSTANLTYNLDSDITLGALTANTNGGHITFRAGAGETVNLTTGDIQTFHPGTQNVIFTNGAGSLDVTTTSFTNRRIVMIGDSVDGLSGFTVTGTTTTESTLRINYTRTMNDPDDITVRLGTLNMGGLIAIGNSSNAINNVEVNSLTANSAGNNLQLGSAPSGTLTIAGTEDATFIGQISELGATTDPGEKELKVVKNGTSIQTFTSVNNNYMGGTVINDGTLKLVDRGRAGNRAIHLAGENAVLDISEYTEFSSTYILGPEQMLSGIGTVVATGVTLQVNGSISPGNSIGQLTISGGLTDMSGVAELIFEIGATADSILFTNGANVDIGILNFDNFNFIAVAGFGAGDYTLLDGWNVLEGSLGVTDGMIDGMDASLAIQGNSLVLTVVPEPTTVALTFGILALLAVGLRRRLGNG